MRRRGKIGIGIGAGLFAAALAAWPITATVFANAVTVTTDAHPYVCTNPDDVSRIHFGTRDVATLRMNKLIDCTLSIRIHNEGAFAATIPRVTFPGFGPYGVVVEIDRIDGMKALGSVDATSDPRLDLTIEPGETHVLTAHLKAAYTVCMGDGASHIESEKPHVTVKYLGLSFLHVPNDAWFAFTGTSASDKLGCTDTREIPNNNYDEQQFQPSAAHARRAGDGGRV